MMMEQHAVLRYLVILHLIHSVAGAGWSMSYEPSSGICALKGSSVTMTCSYTYPPDLRVQRAFWTLQRYGDQPDITRDPKYSKRVQVDWGDKTCTLRLSNVSAEDHRRVFYCRVITQQEKQKWTGRAGMNLSVTDLQVRSPGYLREGKDVSLTCVTTCTLSGSHRFVWEKDGNRMEGKNSDTLHLRYLDRNHEGSYTCAVEGHSFISSPPLTISITYPPKDVMAMAYPSGVIFLGRPVTLACVCDANPPMVNYAWFKKGISTELGLGPQYSITKMQTKHAGQYYCKATNTQGEGRSLDTRITIADPPQNVWVFVHPSGSVMEGSSVTLACVSDASPPVENYTWLKNNISVASGQRYIITNMCPEDAGLYFCKAHSDDETQMSNGTDIKIANDECQCVAATSMGVLSGSVLVTLSGFILFRFWSKRREHAEDLEEDSNDEADEKPKPAMKLNSQHEDNDYGDYGNCDYGNMVQMKPCQEDMDVYDAPQDEDVYQNVEELSM